MCTRSIQKLTDPGLWKDKTWVCIPIHTNIGLVPNPVDLQVKGEMESLSIYGFIGPEWQMEKFYKFSIFLKFFWNFLKFFESFVNPVRDIS